MSIVLGYDESPGARRALVTAIDLAKRFDEVLVLVNGVGPPGNVGEEFRSHLTALTEIGRAATQHAVEKAEAAGVRTVVELIDDKPAPALIQAADKHDAQVIVVGTYGESPLRGAMLGSTTQAAAPVDPAGALRAGATLRDLTLRSHLDISRNKSGQATG